MLEIGKNYLVDTGVKLYVGRLVSQQPFMLSLADASWVADTGRLHEFVKNGRADGNEIEPVGSIVLRWESAIPWNHKLPKEAV